MTPEATAAVNMAMGNAVAFAWEMHKDVVSSSFDVASTIMWSLINDGFAVVPTEDALF